MRTHGLITLTILAATFVLGGCATSGALPDADPLTSVETLDRGRYLGTWYEIARYPTSFQKDLVGVTAEYTEGEDDSIVVVNRGRVKTLDGKEKSARAKAWIPDAAQPGRLRVRFFWPFTGDYWVIALDEDYRWAVVGEPKRRYLWILSRTPQMDDDTERMIRGRITELGYDVDRLQNTLQGAE